VELRKFLSQYRHLIPKLKSGISSSSVLVFGLDCVGAICIGLLGIQGLQLAHPASKRHRISAFILVQVVGLVDRLVDSDYSCETHPKQLAHP